MHRIATIDLGTNTFLLLITEYTNGRLLPIFNEQRIPRIGSNVDKNKILEPNAFKKAFDVLSEYKQICDRYEVEKIIAVGTSALREAKNSNEFVNFIKKELGIDIEIISGYDEANYTYIGGLSFMDIDPSQKYAVIDIGGGSTEIIYGQGNNVINKVSLNIGSVRLTEKYLKNDPPLEDEISKLKENLYNSFSKLDTFSFKDTVLIGVAGTVTTLAMIDRCENQIYPDKIMGHKIYLDSLQSIVNKLSTSKVSEIESKYFVQKGRSDVILAGMIILETFMKMFSFDSVLTSICGLRHGIALREFGKLKK